MKLWLQLEPTAGTDIQGVAKDMVEASNRFNMPIQVRVNGVLLLCKPGRKAEDIEAQYRNSK